MNINFLPRVKRKKREEIIIKYASLWNASVFEHTRIVMCFVKRAKPKRKRLTQKCTCIAGWIKNNDDNDDDDDDDDNDSDKDDADDTVIWIRIAISSIIIC